MNALRMRAQQRGQLRRKPVVQRGRHVDEPEVGIHGLHVYARDAKECRRARHDLVDAAALERAVIGMHRRIGQPGRAAGAGARHDLVGCISHDQRVHPQLAGQAIELALQRLALRRGRGAVGGNRGVEAGIFSEGVQLDQDLLLALLFQRVVRALRRLERVERRVRHAALRVHRQDEEHRDQHHANRDGRRHQRPDDQTRRIPSGAESQSHRGCLSPHERPAGGLMLRQRAAGNSSLSSALQEAMRVAGIPRCAVLGK
jgi:hypothetical protein